MSRFLDKWLLDMKSEQGHGGGIPMVIPRQGDNWPTLATSCWGDSTVIVPWAQYQSRGDLNLLRRQYPVMKKFNRAAKRWASLFSFDPYHWRIWRFPFHFGDWCAPNETIKQWLGKGKYVATAYWANSCALEEKIAILLNKPKDAAYYHKLRKQIIKSYQHVFMDKNMRLKQEFQTGYVLPIYFKMGNSKQLQLMADHLNDLVVKNNYHLATGFTGTPYLLFALSDYGHIDTAYHLLMQTDCPSWLYEVKAGGTTIWERWDALRPDGTVNIADLTGNKDDESNGGMVSFNHYANGAVGAWLYRRVAGLEMITPGYKKFKFAPLIGKQITSANIDFLSPYGPIKASWKILDNKIIYQINVPVSCTCELILVDKSSMLLKSGNHHIESKL